VAIVVSSANLLGAYGIAVVQPPSKLLLRPPDIRQPQEPLLLAQEGVLSAAESPDAPRNYVVRKVSEIPHLGKPWTQGLEFSEGHLIETSGDYPPGSGSYVRIVDPSTGDTVRKITVGLESPLFIEGIARMGNSWFASTYENHKLVEFDDQLNIKTSHDFPWQGWGLAPGTKGTTFLATNSTEYVMTLDAASLQTTSVKAATCFGKRVVGLNELETVQDFFGRGPAMLGNIINTRLVLVLDPSTAKCTGVFHLNDLEPIAREEQLGLHVANGIAYDKQTDTFWVTGKNWDKMFQIKLTEDEDADSNQAVRMLSGHLSR